MKLVDKKVFKPIKFNPQDTVKSACLRVAELTEMRPDNYGLFLPGSEDSVGQWLRDDYPLDFYGFEGEEVKRVRESKQQPLDPNKKSPDFIEWKNKLRAIKVLVGKSDRGFLVDDTAKVSQLIDSIGQEFGFNIAIDEDSVFANGDDDVEVLSNDMTLREQGYYGECFVGLFTKVKGSTKRADLGLYIKLPFYEGYLQRKGGGLSAWKKRWYVLRKNKLQNFKSEKTTKKELGVILMKSVKEIKKTPSSVSDVPKKQQHCCFEILTDTRPYKMLAKNTEDKDNWYNQLELARKMFADENDLEDMLAQQRKRLEDEYKKKREKDEASQKEQEEKERAEKARLEREERERKEAEARRKREEEERKRKLAELEAKRREEEELYMKLALEESEMEREFNELEEELREIEARKNREADQEMFKLLEDQEKEMEEELKRMERELQRLAQEKKTIEEKISSPQESIEDEIARSLAAAEDEALRMEEELRRMQEEELKEQERKEREEQERKRREEKQRRDEERRKRIEEQQRLEEERRKKAEEERRLEEERRAREEEEKRAEIRRKEEAALQARLAEEKEALERELAALEAQRKAEEEERQRQEEERRRQEEERLRQEEEERKRREEEARAKEEERKRREEEAKRKLEEERKRLEEERKKREEEEARRWEEEVRRREEEERLRREEEERLRREEEEREERYRREEVEEAARAAEEEKIRQVEEAERRRQEEEEEKIKEEERKKAALAARSTSINKGEDSVITDAEKALLSQILSSGDGDAGEAVLKDWSTLKGAVLAPVSADTHPELAYILPAEKDASEVAPEEALKSWVNYHLRNAKSDRVVTNFEEDWRDGQVLTVLLNQLDPDLCGTEPLQAKSSEERAQLLVENLSSIGLEVDSRAIEEGNHRLNLSLAATIFKLLPGLGDVYTEIQSKRTVASKYIETKLAADPVFGPIQPIPPRQFLRESADSVMLCKLVNQCFGEVIDERILHLDSPSRTTAQIEANWNICINAVQVLSAQKFGVDVKDLVTKKGEALEHLTWTIVETCILSHINPTRRPDLFKLQLASEERDFFVSLTPKKLITRWVNYFLRNHKRYLTNFTDDFEDSANFIYLLNAIAPEHCSLDLLQIDDWEERARRVLEITRAIGCHELITPRDILDAENERLIVVFLAEIFRVNSGLPKVAAPTEFVDTGKKQQTVQDRAKEEQQEEETAVRNWINSLGLDIEVKDLDNDLKDGLSIVKIFNKAFPGVVDQKRLAAKPNTKFAQIELINYAISVGQKLKFANLNLAALEIAEGVHGKAFALVNQARKLAAGNLAAAKHPTRRAASAKDLFRQSRIKATSADDIIDWVNTKIAAVRPDTKIASLTDPIVDASFYLDLISALAPGKVDQSLVDKANSNSIQNYRLLMSVVWSLGIAIPLHPNDFVVKREEAIKTFGSTILVHFTSQVSLS